VLRLDDFIRAADDLPDLDVVVEKRDELLPRAAPQADDGRVLAAPLAGEVIEPGRGHVSVHRGIDRAQVAGHLIPVTAGGVPEGVADQVQDAGLDPGIGPRGGDGVGQALEPVAHHDAHVGDAAVLDLGQHGQPELGALAAVPGPQAQDVPLAVHGDADHHVDGPVGNLPVADLDHDGVHEQHRVDAIERPVAPLGHLLDHLVGDPGDGVLADLRAVDLIEVRGNLPGRQPAGGQRDHDLAGAVQPPLPLAHHLRVEASVAVAGHLDLDGPDLGQHRLGPGAVTGVPAVTPGRIMLVIAQVLRHFRLQGGLQHRSGQPGQQPARPDQLHALSAGPLHQLAGKLLLIDRRWHGLDDLGHNWSFPPSPKARRVGQLHRYADSPYWALKVRYPHARTSSRASLRQSEGGNPGMMAAACSYGAWRRVQWSQGSQSSIARCS